MADSSHDNAHPVSGPDLRHRVGHESSTVVSRRPAMCPDALSASASPEVVWAALAPQIAGQQKVRVWDPATGRFGSKRRLSSRMPSAPAAVRIYDRHRRAAVLVLDFDAKGENTPVEVDRQVDAVVALLGECGGAGGDRSLPQRRPARVCAVGDAAGGGAFPARAAAAARPVPGSGHLPDVERPRGPHHRPGVGVQGGRTPRTGRHRPRRRGRRLHRTLATGADRTPGRHPGRGQRPDRGAAGDRRRHRTRAHHRHRQRGPAQRPVPPDQPDPGLRHRVGHLRRGAARRWAVALHLGSPPGRDRSRGAARGHPGRGHGTGHPRDVAGGAGLLHPAPRPARAAHPPRLLRRFTVGRPHRPRIPVSRAQDRAHRGSGEGDFSPRHPAANLAGERDEMGRGNLSRDCAPVDGAGGAAGPGLHLRGGRRADQRHPGRRGRRAQPVAGGRAATGNHRVGGARRDPRHPGRPDPPHPDRRRAAGGLLHPGPGPRRARAPDRGNPATTSSGPESNRSTTPGACSTAAPAAASTNSSYTPG